MSRWRQERERKRGRARRCGEGVMATAMASVRVREPAMRGPVVASSGSVAARARVCVCRESVEREGGRRWCGSNSSARAAQRRTMGACSGLSSGIRQELVSKEVRVPFPATFRHFATLDNF